MEDTAPAEMTLGTSVVCVMIFLTVHFMNSIQQTLELRDSMISTLLSCLK